MVSIYWCHILKEVIMRYPNGEVYQSKTNLSLSASSRGKANFAKRGMKLEEMINQANQWYLLHDKAVIHKKPTPIQVVSVDYPKRSRAVITEAYYRTASTTDYNGIYNGHYLDFEAKQTNLKTKFPLHNIHQHQIDHMTNCANHGGICFILFLFKERDEAYVYPIRALLEDWTAFLANDITAIPLKRIQSKGVQANMGYQPRIDYLAAVDEMIAANYQN